MSYFERGSSFHRDTGQHDRAALRQALLMLVLSVISTTAVGWLLVWSGLVPPEADALSWMIDQGIPLF